MAALAIDASGRIFAGERTGTQGGVFRSTDNGETWTPTGPAGAQVYSLAINRNGPPPLIGQIFAGTEGSGIFRSTDNGTNWTQVNTGLTLWYVPALAINSSGHIFGGTTAGADAGVVRSTNNGENWTPVLTGPSVSALVTNSSGHIYASGVFRSTDNGEHWDTVSSGVTDYVWAFAVNSGGYIFAGTGGSGVFRSVQSTTFVPERHGGQPTSFTLGQNYPNPFNPKTSIKFKVQSSKLVTLRVYNVLGQEVATLVNEELQPGSYEVAWDAEGLASGVYFYRLAAGEFTAAKKLVLLL
ncbi:MAG: T9SS type A sorting domain-containing protein [Ignavibacteriae bacterium]|nr:T9SS type A sorting domain-containing protein [Ignavibacteriota bacterium]